VTIRAFRLYLQYEDKAIARAMNLTHFGMTDWVSLRLNDIRQSTAANRFFERRSSRTTRTCGSPNTPRTLAAARKPANEYPSDRRRSIASDVAAACGARRGPSPRPRHGVAPGDGTASIDPRRDHAAAAERRTRSCLRHSADPGPEGPVLRGPAVQRSHPWSACAASAQRGQMDGVAIRPI
jgi:hypothetical protein